MINEFNKFMISSNNLNKPSTLPELSRILTNMNGAQLLFAITRIYQTVDLNGRHLLKTTLDDHKQRPDIETSKSSTN